MTCGPGTLEIATLVIGGMRLASLERPKSAAMPLISQGAPSDGKSVGITDFMLAIVAFAAALASRIACSRSSGSAMSLARLTRIIDAWVFISVLPGSRRLTGTPASSGFGGQRVDVGQVVAQRAGADRQHDVVDRDPVALGDAPRLGQRQRQAGEGALVGDCHVQRRARREPVALGALPGRRPRRRWGAADATRVRASVGSARTSLTDCSAVWRMPAAASSAMPKVSASAARDARALRGTLRGTGLTSSIALASTMPPAPSSAAWWTLE